MTIKKAFVKQLNGLTFAARMSSNHWVMMDTAVESGGNAAASSPKELILAALAGCTGMDVASMLVKRRIELESFTMDITAQEAEHHPKVYTEIHIEYIFRGVEIEPSDVERAIELSQKKYCSVSHMLKQSVNITTSYRIEEPVAVEAVA